MDVVWQIFAGYVISRFNNASWPARSPDLLICDFFLLEYIKSTVYVNKPHMIERLKLSIHQEIEVLPD